MTLITTMKIKDKKNTIKITAYTQQKQTAKIT